MPSTARKPKSMLAYDRWQAPSPLSQAKMTCRQLLEGPSIRRMKKPRDSVGLFSQLRLLAKLAARARRLSPNTEKKLPAFERDSSVGREAGLHVAPDYFGPQFGIMVDIREHERFRRLAQPAVESGLTLLYWDRLYTLFNVLNSSRRRFADEPFFAAEIGVFKGGGSHFICSILANEAMPVDSFLAIDTFEGHDARDLDLAGEPVHGQGKFSDTQFKKVRELLQPFSFAEVLKGRVQEFADRLKARPLHFLHLDVDLMTPTLWSLRELVPLMPKGAVIVLDDHDKRTCPGIRKAAEAFLEAFPQEVVYLPLLSAQAVMVKV